MRQLDSIRHVALDLDGTLYLGGRLFPCTIPFLKHIREMGIGRTFFTNNSSVSTDGYVKKLANLGIDASADEIYSSTSATLAFLKAQVNVPRSLFVLGTPALRQEFSDSGFHLSELVGDAWSQEPDAVVVGFDSSLVYPRLCQAAYWISKGKPFYATNGDLVCPTDQPTVLPDCGSICQLLSHATGRFPDAVLGKPSPGMLTGVMKRHGLRPDEIAVVGDRLSTDIAMACSAGAVGVLVLSGEATLEMAAVSPNRPDIIVQDVGELAMLLSECRGSTLCQTDSIR